MEEKMSSMLKCKINKTLKELTWNCHLPSETNMQLWSVVHSDLSPCPVSYDACKIVSFNF